MAPAYLLYVLSRPYNIPASSWEQFYRDDHLDDLIKNNVATKGSMYRAVPNPMGRAPPDYHTHLVLFETQHDKPFQFPGFKRVNNTSPLFPAGASTPDVSQLECRHYSLLEVFNPKDNDQIDTPAPFLLQTEILVDDISAFQRYYREDHIPMMVRHQAYRRATMYSYLETSVVYGVEPDPSPGTVIVVHEWENLDELGGPTTQAALETEYAIKMRAAIRSIRARALELVCVDSSQR